MAKKQTLAKGIRAKNIRHAIRVYDGNRKELIHEIKARGGYIPGIERKTIYDMARCGFFLTHTDEKRQYLKRLLHETEAEANKYDDEKVEHLYNWLMARDLSTIPEFRKP